MTFPQPIWTPRSAAASGITMVPSTTGMTIDTSWDGNEVTVGPFDIGTAAADRQIFALISHGSSGNQGGLPATLDTVDIGGSAATQLLQMTSEGVDEDEEYYCISAIWSRLVTAGTSISVDLNGDPWDDDDNVGLWVTIVAMTGAGTGTPTVGDSATDEYTAGSGNATFTLDSNVLDGGAVVACGTVVRASENWSGTSGLDLLETQRSAANQQRAWTATAGGPFTGDETPRSMSVQCDDIEIGNAMAVAISPA